MLCLLNRSFTADMGQNLNINNNDGPNIYIVNYAILVILKYTKIRKITLVDRKTNKGQNNTFVYGF